MKGFLFALVGDLLSINAIASAFLPGIILKEIDASEKMNIQTVISNSSLMLFLALTVWQTKKETNDSTCWALYCQFLH